MNEEGSKGRATGPEGWGPFEKLLCEQFRFPNVECLNGAKEGQEPGKF